MIMFESPQYRQLWNGLRAGTCLATLVLLQLDPSYALAQMAAGKAEAGAEEVVGYDQVREVLRKRCVTCHNLDELRGDLNLADLPAIRAGSASGPVVVAGKPNQSSLYKCTAHLEDPVMPPNSPRIPPRELDLLRRWIEGGLAEKTGEKPSVAASETEMAPPVKAQPSADQPLEDLPAQKLAHERENVHERHPYKIINKGLRPTAIMAFDVHPTQNLAAVSGDRQAALFNPMTGEFIGALDFPEGEVTAMRFSRDGTLLVVAGGIAGLSGRVVGFDVATGTRVFELADENDTILAVDLSVDGNQIAVGGPAKVVRIFDVASGSVLHTLRKHTDWVLTLRFSPDALLLASGDRFGGLFVWDPKSGEEFHTLRGHTGAVNAVTWQPKGEELLSAGDDGAIRTWNMHHGDLMGRWDAGVGAVLSLTTNAEVIAAGGRKNRVTVWRASGEGVFDYETADQVERIGLSAGGAAIVAVDAAGGIQGFARDAAANAQYDLRYTTQLPVDDAGFESLLAKIELAETEYANRMEAAPEEFAALTPPISSPYLAIEAEIQATEQQLTAMRAQVRETQKTVQTIAESILAADAALHKLRNSQDSLAQQVEAQSAMAGESERRLAALKTIQMDLGSGQADRSESVKRTLQAKLEQQQRLLQATLALQSEFDQVQRDTDGGFELDKSRELLAQLSRELESKTLATQQRLRTLNDNTLHTTQPDSNTFGSSTESDLQRRFHRADD
jgi:mono/diheme cytochrome c family protein